MIYSDPNFVDATPNEIASLVFNYCRALKRRCHKQFEVQLKRAEAVLKGDRTEDDQ